MNAIKLLVNDLELDDRIFEKGETHECSWERAKDLESKGLARMI